jgi:hypothetical protein
MNVLWAMIPTNQLTGNENERNLNKSKSVKHKQIVIKSSLYID